MRKSIQKISICNYLQKKEIKNASNNLNYRRSINLINYCVQINSYRPTGHKAAVQSFGRYVGVGPGLHFVTPIIRNIAYVVDMRQRSLDLDPQEIITKTTCLTIDASAKYHVDNLEEYLYGNTNPEGLLLLDIKTNYVTLSVQ